MSTSLSTHSSTTPRTHAPRPGLGALLVLAAGALWGTTGTTAAFAPAGTSPLAIGAATMGIGGLFTFGFAARQSLAVLFGEHRRSGTALLGGLCVVIYPLTFYSAMSLAGIAIGTVVSIGASPIFAALYERFIDGKRLQRRWLIATPVTALGCVLLVTAGQRLDGGHHTAVGVVLGLAAAASYAGFSYLATRIMRGGHSASAAMGSLFGLGACALLPVLSVTAGPLLSNIDGWLVTGYLALVPMCGAYILFGSGLRHVGASTATTLSVFETVVATILSVIIVAQRLSAGAWTGLAIVALGLVILTVHRPDMRR